MEYNKNKKSVNGYREGYNYPIGHYGLDLYDEDKKKNVEGSFWTHCDKKSKNRHSFCDGY